MILYIIVIKILFVKSYSKGGKKDMCKPKKRKKDIIKAYNKAQDIPLSEKEIHLTNHFCQRWRERIFNQDTDTEDIYNHINTNISNCSKLKSVSGDFYLLNEYLVIAAEENQSVTLITVLGSTDNCGNVYDYIKHHGAFSFHQALKKYGKIPLVNYQ